MKYKMLAFVNDQYLSDKQCGIQAAHMIAEFRLRYDSNSKEFSVYDKWNRNDKTLILLRGGNSVSLKELYYDLIPPAEALNLPMSSFYEDETLNYTLTSIGIVIPVFEDLIGLSDLELKLLDITNSKRLL